MRIPAHPHVSVGDGNSVGPGALGRLGNPAAVSALIAEPFTKPDDGGDEVTAGLAAGLALVGLLWRGVSAEGRRAR